MRKAIALIAILAIAGAVSMLPGGADAAGTTTVKLKDDFFSPSSKTVKKGTRVKFRWTGKHKHNVVKASGPGKSFQSKLTKRKGVNFKKRFNRRGNYLLVCSIHSGMDLNLKVKR